MIAVALIGIALGYLGIYSGITNRDPRNELVANFHGGHSDPKAGASSTAPSVDSSPGSTPAPEPSAGTYKTGKKAMLPASICQHPGILVDKGTVAVVKHICATFNVRVSSGYSLTGHAPNSDHRCGLACDFVGKDSDLRDLFNWAGSQGFAYVEPWADSMTVGRLGTTGKHVHISFSRCSAQTVASGG